MSPAATGMQAGIPWLARMALLAASALALGACATQTVDPVSAWRPGTVATLAPGAQARLPDGTRLDYLGLRSDSRCPDDVVCVHAGWAEVTFSLRPATGPSQTLVLSTRAGAGSVEAGGWRFDLVEVGRGPSPAARVRASKRAEK